VVGGLKLKLGLYFRDGDLFGLGLQVEGHITNQNLEKKRVIFCSFFFSYAISTFIYAHSFLSAVRNIQNVYLRLRWVGHFA
jgi:hypothetical protein